MQKKRPPKKTSPGPPRWRTRRVGTGGPAAAGRSLSGARRKPRKRSRLWPSDSHFLAWKAFVTRRYSAPVHDLLKGECILGQ